MTYYALISKIIYIMINKIRTIFFDIDDTLYDSSHQAEEARINAILAMREAGLDVSQKKSYNILLDIVKEYGSNYPYHFNELLTHLGYGKNPRIIAAGVIAYHVTKIAYLVPFTDTIPTLLKLRDTGYHIGIITDGLAVKQWEKIIRLGLQHFMHTVTISEEVGKEKPDPAIFTQAIQTAGCIPQESIMVGDRPDKDIEGANLAGMRTVQIMKGKYSTMNAENKMQKPDYFISDLSDIIKILDAEKQGQDS